MESLKKPKTPPKNPSAFNFSNNKHTNEKPMSSDRKIVKNKVTTAEPVFEKTVRPKNNKIAYIILSIILIAIVIGVSSAMIVIFPTAKRINDIKINFNAVSEFEPISILPEGDDSTTRHAMPGDKVKCNLKITSQKDPEFVEDVNLDVFIRFKIILDCDGDYISMLDGENNLALDIEFVENVWIRGVDGYYYFAKTDNSDGLLSPGETIEITKYFYLSTEIGNEYQGKEIGILFRAEALQANYQAVKELWPTAPYQWYSQFRDLV